MKQLKNNLISFYYKMLYERRRRVYMKLEQRLGSIHPLTIKWQRKTIMTLPKIYSPWIQQD